MGSLDKLQQLKQKEREIEIIFEELKQEKRKEAIEQVSKMLAENRTEEARKVIERMEELKEVKWERNGHVIKKMAEMFNVKDEDLEIDYEQLKTDYETKEAKSDIVQMFEEQLKNRGFDVEEKKEDVLQLRKDGEALFFFEIKDATNTIGEIEKRQKYSSILIGVATLQDEDDTELKINEWLQTMPVTKRETVKKYLSFNITSKQRLTEEEESFKLLKVA